LPLSGQNWTAEIAFRLRRHLLLKVVGTTLWTWLFFAGYFHLLKNPTGPPWIMPRTPLDDLIPFQPYALFPYLTLWVYVGVAPGLQRSFLDLLVYGMWSGALCLAGLGMFYAWPTQVPPLGLDASGFPGFALLQGVDAPGNACPSMHVAIAIFTALWIEQQLREVGVPKGWRVANWGWFCAIVYSTLAVKQHVVLDVVAGALLGAAVAVASFYWRPSRTRRRPETLSADTDIIGHH
jgi:membrane-associated phospholipid phosphatase